MRCEYWDCGWCYHKEGPEDGCPGINHCPLMMHADLGIKKTKIKPVIHKRVNKKEMELGRIVQEHIPYGIMDCIKALRKCEYDVDNAVQYLKDNPVRIILTYEEGRPAESNEEHPQADAKAD